MPREELENLYKMLDNFQADLTQDEANKTRDAFVCIFSQIHKRIINL